jgi:2-polyprenyl-3-methyl-5-hydroxy-6-metoxy-1,4-benzoquinol methylase
VKVKSWIENRHLRNRIIPLLSHFFEKTEKNKLNEQAVPSYLHPSGVMRETFWLRIMAAHAASKPGKRTLDFGSGLGAMLPWHEQSGGEVFLYDSNPLTLQYLAELNLKKEFRPFQILTGIESLKALPDGHFDNIFALDVLEHIENLDEVLLVLRRLLSPNGRLIVSSPTENWAYRFARNFGGEGYQGEFHERAAKEVEAALAKFFEVQLTARIYPILTFFRIVVATKK